MGVEPVIMVQVSDREWTLESLHCACLVARKVSARIALVKLIPVQHLSWLGTEWGYLNFTPREQADLADFQATIEDYGVEFTPVIFQYATLPEATIQVADYINAQIVFAQIPESKVPFWGKFQRWILNRNLLRQNRQWIQHPIYDPDISGIILAADAEINNL